MSYVILLNDCDITTCDDGAVSGTSTHIRAIIQTSKTTLKMRISMCFRPGLWAAQYGLNIKSLSLSGWGSRIEIKFVDSFSQSLSSLTQLESLSINRDDNPGVWKTLNGLNIKTLTLICWTVTDLESFSQSLSSLKQY
ncbi:hypothetical protein DPMN_042134 [Dreissena polymorpha]|uniref:Uncharacterized protein n=1 Tax=Dreissena polymorpha TaxID=45954 RepID=A0A9D4CY36_DREPO|nr:hypothetical protein DPMN_042134 [Dreissena polymorpha]